MKLTFASGFFGGVHDQVMLRAAALAAAMIASSAGSQTPLPAPGFHHLHLNSTDPDAAIAFYVRQFPSTSKTSWGGMPALASPNNVLVLFNQVNTAPASDPETAFWHFGWHVTDVRKNMATYQGRTDVMLAPLYTGDGAGSVSVSSDTWPGTGGVLGRTAAQIADAKANGVQPARGVGSRTCAGRTMRSSSIRGTSRPSASTTCTSIRTIRSARRSGIGGI